MQARKPQTIVLAGLATLALVDGASRSLHPPRTGGNHGTSELSIGEQAQAPTEIRMTGPAAVPPRSRVAVASGRPVTEPASSREWPVILETASDPPPMDLSEPLDAGNSDARESIALALDLISIGPVLNAEDDPLAYELGTPYRSPISIGEALNADDPGTPPVVDADPISIGPNLDADDPQGWDFHQPAPPVVEIGEILDAGTPSDR